MGSPNTNDLFQIGKLNTTGEGAPIVSATLANNSLANNVTAGGSIIGGWSTILDDPYGMVQTVPAALALITCYSAFKIIESGIYDVSCFYLISTSSATGCARVTIGYTLNPGALGAFSVAGVASLAQSQTYVNNVVLLSATTQANGVFIPKGAYVVFYITYNNGAGTLAVNLGNPELSQASIRLVRPTDRPGTIL